MTYTVLRIRIAKQSPSGHEIPESQWGPRELTMRRSREYANRDDADHEADAWNVHANWHAWVVPTSALGAPSN